MSIKIFLQLVASCFTGTVLAIAFFILVFALAGCSAIQTRPEMAYQMAHAMDVQQTLQISDGKSFEQESAWLLGERPSREKVYAWGVGLAVGHALISEWMLDRGYTKSLSVWECVTTSMTLNTVNNNYNIGLRIGF